MPSFINLHNHSHYSLLEALPKIKDLVAHAKDLGMDALALTDNGNMFGAVEFYQACEKAGLKPILGYDAYVAIDTVHDKRPRIDNKAHRLVLLAENIEGYRNLLKLATVAYLEGFYYRPRIDRNLLRDHSEGLIALAGHRSDIAQFLGDEEKLAPRLKEYLDIFGKDRLFFELQHQPDDPAIEEANRGLVALGKKEGVGVVASRNTYYLNPDDAEARKLLLCIKDGRTVEERDRVVTADPDLSMVSPEEIEEAFKDVPEAVENARKLADRCAVELELGKWFFPNFEIPENHTPLSYLREQAFDGLKDRLGRDLNERETERLNYELGIIETKGYATYFLVVADYTQWANNQGIMNTTRGSAAGSLMGYAVGISHINPLDYNLPFERFLNPMRPSAPDVDSDFADDRRGDVIRYVTEKYGKDHVAQICTFGTMKARGSVRDVGRALGFPYDFCDVLSKMVPDTAKNLKGALEESQELKTRYTNEEDVRRLLDLAMRIEGNARHCSVHAAGVVISDKPLTHYTALQKESKGESIITQYEMHSVEAAGVLKMDFLGIRNLATLGKAIDLVRETKNVDVDIHRIPLDDEKTFRMLANGETMGVFQLSGDGMTKWLVQLKPSTIHDIMAMVALYRPGPMEQIPDYIRRKYNPKLVTYPDPRMKDFLEPSFGLLVYQDDVMLTAIHLAGYNWLEADKLRKAMGKKIAEEMARQEVKFKEGIIENGGTKTLGERLWDLIRPFAQYGFNKAHACSYGMVAYQTAYMKANFPSEYMAALMTAESHNLDTIAEAVAECSRMGISVLPPDVNESGHDFTYIDDETVRFGLGVIKNLGDDMIRAIVEEREAEGPFTDLADLASRIHGKAFNKKSLEALAKSGALDRFGERNRIVANIDIISLYNRNMQKEKESGQTNLFAFAAPEGKASRPPLALREVPPADKQDLLAWEKELLGLYVSSHPFEEVAKEFGKLITPIEAALKSEDRSPVRVGGTVTAVKQILTKKKQEPMLFATIEDVGGAAEVLVFPSVFRENGEVWKDGANLIVTGKVSHRDGESKILADRGWPVTEETAEVYKRHFEGKHVTSDMMRTMATGTTVGEVAISVPAGFSAEGRASLKEILSRHPGKARVILHIPHNGSVQKVRTDYRVEPSKIALGEIESCVGFGNVKADGALTGAGK